MSLPTLFVKAQFGKFKMKYLLKTQIHVTAEKLHYFHSLLNGIKTIKSRRVRCAGRVACMGAMSVHMGVWLARLGKGAIWRT
jgi:hypothetical protein